MKKILSVVLAISIMLTLGAFPASAATNDSMDSIEQEMFDYHRMCDETAGNILEKYDTLYMKWQRRLTWCEANGSNFA